MNIKFSTFFIAILLIVNFSYAQNSFDPGFIISQENDTLPGFIEDKVDIDLKEAVQFATSSAGNDSKKYTPSDILGFGFDSGRSFESVVTKDGSGRVFAKKVATGKLKVLLEENKNSKFNLYLYRMDTNMSVILEGPEKTTVEIDNKKLNQTDKKYLGLLSFVTEDPGIPALRYSEKALINYLNKYNQRYSGSYASSVYAQKLETSYDVSFGLQTSENNGEFRIAVFRDRKLPEKNRKAYQRAGITYRRADVSGNSEDHIINILPLGFKINLSENNITPYFNSALGLAFSVTACDCATNEGTQYSFGLIPGLNIGAGVRAKISSKYIFAEVTPGWGDEFPIFINAGITF